MLESKIETVTASAFEIPTDQPESDGTLEWNSTILVLVEARSGGARGTGYTFADRSTALLINDKLAGLVTGRSAMNVRACWEAMVQAIRNLGRPGIAAMAISAVDVALWDLKARLLDVPLVSLFGVVHEEIAVYGSGGFTSYTIQQLQSQLESWSQRA